MSPHLPLALLALAIAVFLGTQITSVQRGSETVRWQLTNLEKQKSNLETAQKQLEDLIKERDALVQQAASVQQQYNSLLNDVLDLAREDAGAQAVVQKWGIKRQTASAAEPKPEAEAPSGADAGDVEEQQ